MQRPNYGRTVVGSSSSYRVGAGATLDELHPRTFRAGTILSAFCQSGLMSAPRLPQAVHVNAADRTAGHHQPIDKVTIIYVRECTTNTGTLPSARTSDV